MISKLHNRPFALKNRRTKELPASRRRKLALEQVEKRCLLAGLTELSHVFARFEGVHERPVVVPMQVRQEDFSLRGGAVRLGFVVEGVDGSGFNPAAVTARGAGGPLAARVSADDVLGTTSSLAVFDVGAGPLEVTVRGSGDGDFRLGVMLVGDVTGDRVVNFADFNQFRRQLFGLAPRTTEADANLDGNLRLADFFHLAQNFFESTNVDPLDLQAQLDPPPVPLPDGRLATNQTDVGLTGHVTPGAVVEADAGAGPAAIATDGAGAFSTNVGLGEGENSITLVAREPFGQRRELEFNVLSDTTPPAISFDAPGVPPVVLDNVTITGQVADLHAGVDTLTVSVDGAAAVVLPLAADGGFYFTTQFALDGSELGPHVVSFSSVDLLGNQSPPQEFGFELAEPAQQPEPFQITGPDRFVFTPTPTITWDASQFADSYDVTIATDVGLLNPVQQHFALTGTSLVVDPLAEGDYFLGVVARNAAGSRLAANDGFPFTFDVTPPGVFDITNPAAGSETSAAPVVMWNPSVDADEYTLVVSASADLSDPLQTATLAATSLVLDPLAAGTYYVGVTARDAAGNQQPADNNGLSFTVGAGSSALTAFVTSFLVVNNGDDSSFPPFLPFFGSLRGADYYATLAASLAGLIQGWDGQSIIYKAILSTSAEPALNRLAIGDRPIFDTAGNKIADNQADLFDGSIDHPLSHDEFGNDISASGNLTVWTGSSASGSVSDNCSNWGDPSLSAIVGDLNATDSFWISSASQQCFSQARLYAVGPFDEQPLTAFVTSSLVVNDGDDSSFPPVPPFFGSLRGADFYATAAAANAGLIQGWDGVSIIYKAIMSTSAETALNRLAIGDRPIFDTVGNKIADNQADLFDGSLDHPLSHDEFGNDLIGGSNLTVWTGTTASGSDSDNCSNWSDASLSAIVGDLNATDNRWISGASQQCFSQARLYAVGPFEPEVAEFDPPVIAAGLANDTGAPGDGVTRSSDIKVEIADASLISSVGITYDGTSFRRRISPNENQSEVLIRATDFILNGIDPFVEGNHIVGVEVVDVWGNHSNLVTFQYRYEAAVPALPVFQLTSESDTPPLGDFITEEAQIEIEFAIESTGDRIEVSNDGAQVFSCNCNLFSRLPLSLQLGPQDIAIVLTSPEGLTSSFTQTVTRLAHSTQRLNTSKQTHRYDMTLFATAAIQLFNDREYVSDARLAQPSSAAVLRYSGQPMQGSAAADDFGGHLAAVSATAGRDAHEAATELARRPAALDAIAPEVAAAAARRIADQEPHRHEARDRLRRRLDQRHAYATDAVLTLPDAFRPTEEDRFGLIG